jgi:hypothetical protein
MAELDSGIPVKIFYCYARKDKGLRDELENHLEALKRTGKISTWHDRQIEPGSDWKYEINLRLNTCDLIILLISPNFMRSDYCYGIEMQLALERHKAGQARVIPIILRPVDWAGTPIGELQVLPTEGKAITTWRNRDEAFHDVVVGIKDVVDRIFFQKNYEHIKADNTGIENPDALVLSILLSNAPEPSEEDKAWTRSVLQSLIEAPSTGPRVSIHPVTRSPYELRRELEKAAALSQSVLIKVYSKNDWHYIGLGKGSNGKEKPIEASQLLRLIGKNDLNDWIFALMRNYSKDAFDDHIDKYQLVIFDYSVTY